MHLESCTQESLQHREAIEVTLLARVRVGVRIRVRDRVTVSVWDRVRG